MTKSGRPGKKTDAEKAPGAKRLRRKPASGKTGGRAIQVVEEYRPSDVEGLLINELASRKDNEGHGVRPLLSDLIYSSTESMRGFSYNYGFSIGKELYAKFGRSGIGPLLRALENSGMGRMLYTPVMDTVIIKGAGNAPRRVNAETNIHSYEAGIISGYLSAHASSAIPTVETHCAYNGSGSCQFVSKPGSVEFSGSDVPAERIIDAIVDAVDSGDGRGGAADGYMLLGMLPMLKEPLLGEASKFAFLVGRRLAERDRGGDPLEAFRRLASFFGIKDIEIEKRKGGTSVFLKYGPYTSVGGFIDLSTKAFIGFLSKRFNSSVMLKEVKSKNSYAVTLGIKQGV